MSWLQRFATFWQQHSWVATLRTDKTSGCVPPRPSPGPGSKSGDGAEALGSPSSLPNSHKNNPGRGLARTEGGGSSSSRPVGGLSSPRSKLCGFGCPSAGAGQAFHRPEPFQEASLLWRRGAEPRRRSFQFARCPPGSVPGLHSPIRHDKLLQLGRPSVAAATVRFRSESSSEAHDKFCHCDLLAGPKKERLGSPRNDWLGF